MLLRVKLKPAVLVRGSKERRTTKCRKEDSREVKEVRMKLSTRRLRC